MKLDIFMNFAPAGTLLEASAEPKPDKAQKAVRQPALIKLTERANKASDKVKFSMQPKDRGAAADTHKVAADAHKAAAKAYKAAGDHAAASYHQGRAEEHMAYHNLMRGKQQVAAGGPGSGRKPGFGTGKHPGSGRPFGVKSGIHKVLTDAGFQHKGGAAKSMGVTRGTYSWYKHPDSGHDVRVFNGDKWAHANEGGVEQGRGTGAASLREHLSGIKAERIPGQAAVDKSILNVL